MVKSYHGGQNEEPPLKAKKEGAVVRGPECYPNTVLLL